MSNPYEVLRLAKTATIKETVARGVSLASEAESEEKKCELRAAVDALITHPHERAYHQFWEPAGSAYRSDLEDGFLQRHLDQMVERRAVNQRAKRFCAEDCSGVRLLDALGEEPVAAPPHLEGCNPGAAPRTPLALPLEPWELFI